MKKYLIPLTAAVILLITATGIIQADSNSPVQIKSDANKVAKTISAVAPVSQQNDQTAKMQQETECLKTENAVLEKASKAYEDSVNTLKWALGIIIGLVFGSIAYIMFRDRREYEKAVQDAKESAKQAHECEKEAREKLSKIDEVVKTKLDEIENRAKEMIKSIRDEDEEKRRERQKEVNKERKFIKLWSEGAQAVSEGRFEDSLGIWQEIITIKPDDYWASNDWGHALLELAKKKEGEDADRLFVESFIKFQKAIDLKPDYHAAWYNWGNALSYQAEKKEVPDADRLFREAYAKFQKTLEIKPDMYWAWHNWGAALSYQAKKKEGSDADRLFEQSFAKFQKSVELKPDKHNAWDSWGAALLYHAQKKEGLEKERLLQEAKEKLLKAEQIKKGSGSYNLACVAAVKDNEEDCKKWLKTAEEAGTLPTRKVAMEDDDLRPYRDEDWFKAMKWKE